MQTALDHVSDLASILGEDRAVRNLRGQLPLYLSGLPGASKLRGRIQSATTIAEVESAFQEMRETPEFPDEVFD